MCPVPTVERRALEKIYLSTAGHHWHNNHNWLSECRVATWYKVGVLASNVHSLVMSSNNMRGSLPAEISELKQLRMIELATMPGLVGIIPPTITSLTGLRRLCICRCGLRGRIPDSIGNLRQLEELQLFGNALVGKLPNSMEQLTNLRLLSLGEYTGGNRFEPAAIPEFISQMTRLEAIFLANCNLIGPVPNWIGNLRELRQLDLQNNQLYGRLPKEVGNLSNLLYLNLKDNPALNGELPLEHLVRLVKLNRLSLVNCGFSNSSDIADLLQTRLPRCRIWVS